MKKLFIITWVLFSGLLFISCEEDLVDPNSVKPSVTIISPTKNSVISDITQITVKTFDNEKIVRLEIYINHNLFIVDNSPELYHSFGWDTRYYSDGTQIVIDAVAYDNDGNKTESKSAIVYIYRFMPSNLTAQIENDSLIHLEWRDNSTIEDGFEIYEKSGNSNLKRIAVVDSNVTTYDSITKIDTTIDLFYLVRAFKDKEFSNFSDTAKAEIKLWAPENVNGHFESDSVLVLNWEDNNDFEDGYRIFINSINIMDTRENVTSQVILRPFRTNNDYNINIASFNKSFRSSLSTRIYLQFELKAPTSLTLVSSHEENISLNWQNNSEYECKFVVERKTELTDFAVIGITELNQTDFIDFGLDTNRTYTYRVKAITTYNTSLFSNEATISYNNSVIVAASIATPIPLINGVFSGDYKYFFKEADRSLSMIDVDNFSIVKTLPEPPLASYLGHRNIIANDDGSVVVRPYANYVDGYPKETKLAAWDVAKASLMNYFDIPCLGSPLVITSDNSKLLFRTCVGLTVFDLMQKGKEKLLFDVYTTGLIANPSSNEFFFSLNGRLKIYNINTQNIKWVININNGEEIKAVSQDGNLVLTAEGSLLRIRDLQKSEIIFERLISNSNRFLFSEDNRLLLNINENKISVYDINSRFKTKELNMDETIVAIGRISSTHSIILTTSSNLIYLDYKKQWLHLQ